MTWPCFATLAFLTGGQFHRHYWVTLTFPLATVAGVVLARLDVRRAALAAGLAALPSLVSTIRVVVLDRDEVPQVASAEGRSTIDEGVARWYADQRTSTSSLYALCASPAMYAAADTIPPYPYLWLDNVLAARGAQERLAQLFASDDPPTYVVGYQAAAACNPTGAVEAALRTRYAPVVVIEGATIFRLRSG